MKISAIISEYNPMHNGHAYHIERTKELTNSDAIICIMSGNYVQRGMPAIIDKWNRTGTALACGADLVIELPVVYSLSSAEFFAFGAVSLLNSLGVIDNISFGSEIGNVNFIMKMAEILLEEPEDFKISLKQYLDKGYVYPKARSMSLTDYISGTEDIYKENYLESLSSSNNILGIEYCKSLSKLKSSIKAYTIRRQGSNYNDVDLDYTFSSATSIRNYIRDNHSLDNLKEHLPVKSFELLEKLNKNGYPFVFEDALLPFIRYKYFNSKDSLLNLPDVSEGLHNRIYEGLLKEVSYSGLVEMIKSKRYTYTRINRILCQYFVGFDNFDTADMRRLPSPYCRVLGFNETGKKIMRQIKQNADIPMYTKLPKKLDKTMELDIKATQTYSMVNSFISPVDDYLISPIISQQ